MVDIPPTKLAHFKQALKDENMRLTIQRRAILADVLGSDQHREIDEIYLSLKDAGIPISRATIYRTLDILVQVDFVHKMDIGDGRFRYENNLTRNRGEGHRAHHDHMICESCGKIIEFIDHEIERRQEKIAAKHGFTLLRHSHQLFGICIDCRDE